MDVVTLPTSEEYSASNLRRKTTGLQTKASTPLLHTWQSITLKTDNLLRPGGGGGRVLKKRELDLTINMLVYLGQQSLFEHGDKCLPFRRLRFEDSKFKASLGYT